MRLLKPGGRLQLADIANGKKIPAGALRISICGPTELPVACRAQAGGISLSKAVRRCQDRPAGGHLRRRRRREQGAAVGSVWLRLSGVQTEIKGVERAMTFTFMTRRLRALLRISDAPNIRVSCRRSPSGQWRIALIPLGGESIAEN
jgi:hypothetical protein